MERRQSGLDADSLCLAKLLEWGPDRAWEARDGTHVSGDRRKTGAPAGSQWGRGNERLANVRFSSEIICARLRASSGLPCASVCKLISGTRSSHANAPCLKRRAQATKTTDSRAIRNQHFSLSSHNCYNVHRPTLPCTRQVRTASVAGDAQHAPP